MEDLPKTTKRLGRPPTKNKPKRPVGRPKDTKGIMKDYRDRMLTSGKSAKVLEAIFEAALDNEHRNQAAAWNIIVDRIAPKRLFENEVDGAGAPNSFTVKIETAGGPVNINESQDIQATEYKDVTPDDNL